MPVPVAAICFGVIAGVALGTLAYALYEEERRRQANQFSYGAHTRRQESSRRTQSSRGSETHDGQYTTAYATGQERSETQSRARYRGAQPYSDRAEDDFEMKSRDKFESAAGEAAASSWVDDQLSLNTGTGNTQKSTLPHHGHTTLLEDPFEDPVEQDKDESWDSATFTDSEGELVHLSDAESVHSA